LNKFQSLSVTKKEVARTQRKQIRCEL
jgi:hypothetical protein